MNDQSEQREELTYEELFNQTRELEKEIEALKAEKYFAWDLFLEVGRRLQVSSASIKAAVSSLLNYEILWDPANQHEFLQTIDNSVERSSRLVVLLTLAFRAEAGKLELHREPQVFQEIMAILQADIANNFPDLVEKFTLPKDGKHVIVDYEYLILSLKYIFEFLSTRTGIDKLQVQVVEKEEYWILEIQGLDQSTKNLIETMQYCKTVESLAAENLIVPEYILGLHVACEILHLQEVEFGIVTVSENKFTFYMHIPAKVSSEIVG